MKYGFSQVPPQDQLETAICNKKPLLFVSDEKVFDHFSINNLFNTSTSLIRLAEVGFLLMDRFRVSFFPEITSILRNFFFNFWVS